jgi:hypothetical protein
MKKDLRNNLERQGFRRLPGSIAPDVRGRITLGQALREPRTEGLSFRAYVNDAGQVLLDPVVEVPLREQWLFKSPRALRALQKGLRSATEKRPVDRGSFARYAGDE